MLKQLHSIHVLMYGKDLQEFINTLAGGNSKMFYFHPEPWRDDPIWRLHILGVG